MSDKRSNRIPYLDVARALAIVSITTNHAYNRSFAVFSATQAEYQAFPVVFSLLKAMLHSFSRLGVPLFLMITGALLLPRDYSKKYSRFLKHNWLRLFITTEIWLCIMFWYLQLSPSSVLMTRGLRHCLVRFLMTLLFLNPVTMDSMWYMKMILCVYLMIPLFSAALRTLPRRVFLLPIIFILIHSYLVPDVSAFLSGVGIQSGLSFDLSAGNLFSMHAIFLLIGYWIGEGRLKSISTPVLTAGFLTFFCLLSGLQLWLFSTPSDVVVAQGYHSILLFAASVCLFELLRRREYTKKKLQSVCSYLAEISFGIYFVHICIMEGLCRIIGQHFSGIRRFGKFFVLELVSFFGAVLIIQLLRKNRWIGYWLFGIRKETTEKNSIAQHELP